MIDSSGARWRKSSRSGANQCVEVADNLGTFIAVRDSKDPAGAVLAFSPGSWRAFTTSLRDAR
ncbi:hypothetical protein J2S41_007438 [Catenuloplanes atrovinosus]|uniref:DUF397 domain-containing protein n=1 Tax=Catenuloplanes atrovinosus TaxID=137266 RepID=A0AAE3YXZ6_9ACTN|nr:hypothetical protein [Catenuloplanes atrovinosus]